MASPPTSTSHRVLAVVRDDPLLDEVLRLAAAAGVEVEVTTDPGAARGRWSVAPLVVVDSGVLAACAAARLRRRGGVVVATTAVPDQPVWELAVAVGADTVLALPADEATLVRRLADAARDGPSGGLVVGCLGGSGGAGASLLVAGLALAAAARGPALAVDLDPYGGGLDLAFGLEDVEGLRWPDLGSTSGRVSGESLAAALPAGGGVSVLSVARAPGSTGGSGGVAPDLAREVVDAGRRDGATVVLDLPRVLTGTARAVVPLADAVLLVVPAEVRAVAAAATVAGSVAGLTDRTRIVVRSRAGGRSDVIEPEAIGVALDLPVAGSIRFDPRLTAAVEQGRLLDRRHGAFVASCRELSDTLLPGRPRRHVRETV